MSSMRPSADPRRVLVTGGTGFVGSNLVRRLLAGGHDVSVLVRSVRDPWRLTDVSDKVRWIEAAIEDGAALRAILADSKPQWIFHLAAHGAYSWQVDSELILRTNVIGTANLIDASIEAGFDAFVNAGSSSEYGFKDHPPREDEPLDPTSPYAVGKAAATLYCTQAGRTNQAPVTTLRLYSVYGPWEDPRRFIPQLVARGLEGRLPPLARASTARDFVFVEDVCDAFLVAASSSVEPGAVYNVGTGRQTTLLDAVNVARQLFGIGAEPSWGSMDDRVWDTASWVADCSRLVNIGWRPSIDLEHGLRITADWLRSRPHLAARYAVASS
ncbi:MAG: NAD-dependent epimerase/dehydratase family protein [Candidatus Dormibacteraceae bacterium]